MRQQTQAQPVQGVRRAALPQEAPGHRQAALRAGRVDTAQGRQRHAGGFRVRERLVSQGAHRSVVPSAFPAHARLQEPAAGIDSFPDRRQGPPAVLLFQRQNRQRSRTNPCGRIRYPRPAGEFLLGQPWVAQKPLPQPVRNGGFPADGSQQPCDRASVGTGSQVLGRQQRHQRGDPCALVDASLRRPASVPPPGSENPAQAAPGRLHLARRERRQDGVDRGFGPRGAADVRPAAIPILSVCKNLNRHWGVQG